MNRENVKNNGDGSLTEKKDDGTIIFHKFAQDDKGNIVHVTREGGYQQGKIGEGNTPKLQSDGTYKTANGDVVNKDGYLLDNDGNATHKAGLKTTDEKGVFLDSEGQKVDKDGNLIDDNGKPKFHEAKFSYMDKKISEDIANNAKTNTKQDKKAAQDLDKMLDKNKIKEKDLQDLINDYQKSDRNIPDNIKEKLDKINEKLTDDQVREINANLKPYNEVHDDSGFPYKFKTEKERESAKEEPKTAVVGGIMQYSVDGDDIDLEKHVPNSKISTTSMSSLLWNDSDKGEIKAKLEKATGKEVGDETKMSNETDEHKLKLVGNKATYVDDKGQRHDFYYNEKGGDFIEVKPKKNDEGGYTVTVEYH